MSYIFAFLQETPKLHKYTKTTLYGLAGEASKSVKEYDNAKTAFFELLGKGRKMANDGH